MVQTRGVTFLVPLIIGLHVICFYDTLAKGGGGGLGECFIIFGRGSVVLLALYGGGGVSKMDIFLLYNM